MEHRCGERLYIGVPAVVHEAGGEQVPVTIVNLSNGGAFVAVPPEQAAIHGVVELEFRAPDNDTDAFLWRGWVIRQQSNGAGLMFDDRQMADRMAFIAAQRVLRRMQGATPTGADDS